MLLHRYGSIDYILEMGYEGGVEQILKAYEKETEQKQWDLYLMRYQHMTKNDFVPFSEFMQKPAQKASASTKTKEEILEDAEMILASFRKAG
ncbi:hypothetical protein [Paenibacillus sp. DMB5]|uniref:hypothetical protein n=1 Tax=Paenibacillus sp. DMB5 TaxID=1780103 RepID=UPI0009EC5785|nr:hypothetical protein [Paenibacillus sp. DMB5]